MFDLSRSIKRSLPAFFTPRFLDLRVCVYKYMCVQGIVQAAVHLVARVVPAPQKQAPQGLLHQQGENAGGLLVYLRRHGCVGLSVCLAASASADAGSVPLYAKRR